MNTIFERPTLNRTTDKENIALVDRWIADTVDKLNSGYDAGGSENVPTKLSELEDDSMHRTVTDAEKQSWNSKPSVNTVYQTNDAIETSIDDADYVPFSTSSSSKKRITLTNIKAKLKTYFDTLYAAISHSHTKSQITDFAHTHTKSDVTDFAHTHTKSDVTDFTHTHTKSEITDFPSVNEVYQEQDNATAGWFPLLLSYLTNATTTSITNVSKKSQYILYHPSGRTMAIKDKNDSWWYVPKNLIWSETRSVQNAAKGDTIRIPATGTNKHITTDCTVIPIASTSNNTRIKYTSVSVYAGYVEIVLGQSFSGTMGVLVNNNTLDPWD